MAGLSGLSAMVWISLMALKSAAVVSLIDGVVPSIDDGEAMSGGATYRPNTWSMASRPPSSFIFLGSMWMSVRTSLMVQPSRFWYLVTRFATSIPVRE